MKMNVSFLDENRPEIELDIDKELCELPKVDHGFLWIVYNDKSVRMINISLISEITTG